MASMLCTTHAKPASGFWENCFQLEDGEQEQVSVNYASASVVVTRHGTDTPGVRVLVAADLAIPLNATARYTFELWHEVCTCSTN
jgi:hypothetical protein